MPETHKHEWRCFGGDPTMLECSLPGCRTLTRISHMIENAQEYGRLTGERDTYQRCLTNHWLRPTGRKHITRYLLDHPLTVFDEARKPKQLRILT